MCISVFRDSSHVNIWVSLWILLVRSLILKCWIIIPSDITLKKNNNFSFQYDGCVRLKTGITVHFSHFLLQFITIWQNLTFFFLWQVEMWGWYYYQALAISANGLIFDAWSLMDTVDLVSFVLFLFVGPGRLGLVVGLSMFVGSYGVLKS